MIGPPIVPLYCWFLYGRTRFNTGSGEFQLALRKLPTNVPDVLLVPDLVIAFTCTPDDRPCVASNRFEMNWNSAIASRPKLGCRFEPPQQLFVTCRPSMFSCTVPSAVVT